MTEQQPQFTEEQFNKHLRFLTKEHVEEKLGEIRDEPNLYSKMDQLMNTEDLDKKFEEYSLESTKLVALLQVYQSQPLSHLWSILGDHLNLGGHLNKTIKYSPNQPDNPEPNTFYLTDQILNIEGEQLKHTSSFFDRTGDYFYTGSIEDQSDAGLFLDQKNSYFIISLPAESEKIRINYLLSFSRTLGYEIFRTALQPANGKFEKLKDSVELIKREDRSTITLKNLQPGVPSFVIITSENKKTKLFGDFIFSEDFSNVYCSRAVEFQLQGPQNLTVMEKTVGEYIQNFFSSAYSRPYYANLFSRFEQSGPGKKTKELTYNPEMVMRSYYLTARDFSKYGLGRIKNCSVDDISQFSIRVRKFTRKEGQGQQDERIDEQLELYCGVLALDAFEFNYQARKKALFSWDKEASDEQLDLEKLKEEEVQMKERYQKTQKKISHMRGLSIEREGLTSEIFYQGQFVNRRMHGYGVMKVLDGFEFVGRFENDAAVEGTFTHLLTGSKFTGKFKDLKLNDENGRIEVPGLFEYEGNVEMANAHGKGKMLSSNEKWVYEGDFVQNKKHGFGKTTFRSGEVLTVEMKNGAADWQGELVRPNGDRYVGLIKQKKELGSVFIIEGKLVRADGGEEEGVFEVNLEEGGGGDAGSDGDGSSDGAGVGGASGGTLKMMGIGLWPSVLLEISASLKIEQFLKKIQKHQEFRNTFDLNTFSELKSRSSLRTAALTLIPLNLDSISQMRAPLLARPTSFNPRLAKRSRLGFRALSSTGTLFKLAKKVF